MTVFVAVYYIYAKGALEKKGQLIVNSIAASSVYPVMFDQKEVLSSIASSHFSDDDVTAIELFDADGSMLYEQSRDAAVSSSSSLPISYYVFNKRVFPNEVQVTVEGESEFQFSVQENAIGDVRLTLNTGVLYRSVGEIILICFTTLAISWWLIAMLADHLSKKFTYPLKRLIDAMKSVEKGNFDYQIPNVPVAEIQQLCEFFQQMTEEIERHQNYQEDKINERTRELSDSNAQLIKLNKEMLDANHAKTQFLANISHELRTPLNALSICTDTLLKEQLTQRQLDCLDQIKRSERNIVEMIEDILNFSEQENDNQAIVYNKVKVAPFFEKCVGQLSNAAQEKGIGLYFTPAKDLPTIALIDEKQTLPAVTNLLGNAIKFTKEGSVTLNVKYDHDESQLIIEVMDTGIGIPEAFIEEIFVPFKQVDGSNARRYGGTGLGLSIVKGSITRLGGTINVESTEGLGSKFTIQLEAQIVQSEIGDRRFMEDMKDVTVALMDYGATKFIRSLEGRLYLKGLRNFEVIRPSSLDAGHWDILVGCDLRRCEQEILTARKSGKVKQVITFERTSDSKDLGRISELDAYDYALPLTLQINQIVNKMLDARTLVKHTEAKIGHGSLMDSKEIEPAMIPELVDDRPISGQLIMIVDDSDMNRDAMSMQLEGLGAKVQLAESGEDAIRLASSAEFDCILMDLMMPEMTGDTATRIIRNLENINRGTPIICVTASQLAPKNEELQSLFDGILIKPYNDQHMVNAIIEATMRKQALVLS
ncbi:ATP-binding protein [Neptuniibacter sp. QD37_11]|uniref:ATP-binding protein n=1 Tax=Neptuniibacter sp. QD37_11 TaxID=3398209 RepID=UPI0039F4E2DE